MRDQEIRWQCSIEEEIEKWVVRRRKDRHEHLGRIERRMTDRRDHGESH